MDYLQYIIQKHVVNNFYFSFKPCYKWITFNISYKEIADMPMSEIEF